MVGEYGNWLEDYTSNSSGYAICNGSKTCSVKKLDGSDYLFRSRSCVMYKCTLKGLMSPDPDRIKLVGLVPMTQQRAGTSSDFERASAFRHFPPSPLSHNPFSRWSKRVPS